MMKIAASIFKTFFLSLCIIANTHLAFAQTASILPQGKTQFLDNNAKPLTSGTVDFYTGNVSSTTRKTTWQNSGETVANTNPVVLDAGGRAIIYGDGSYRMVVKDRLNNLVYDQLTSSSGSGGSGATATGDGDLVGTIKPWAGMSAPNQYMFTYGQEVNRVTFSALFTAITSTQAAFCNSGSPTLNGLTDTTNFWIGMSVEIACVAPGFTTIIAKTTNTVTLAINANVTTNTNATFFPWGNGNHTNTFNIPDFRGLIPVGNNIMGGVASTNINNTFFGVGLAESTGSKGGSLTGGGQTLTQPNLPNIAPTFTGNTNNINQGSISQYSGAYTSGVPNSGGSVVGFNNANPTAITPTFTPTGAISSINGNVTQTSFSILPPLKSTNFIIKVTPDANSATANGVTSFGGMTGSIACGAGLLCTGNTVSTVGAGGTVTSVALTAPAIFTVSGSPIIIAGTLGLTANGTSGGVPYFDSATTMASSGLLTNNALVLGGGAAAAPKVVSSLGTTTTVLHGNAAGGPSFASVISADLNLTTTTCTNQFVTAISTGGVGTCTTSILASSQYANQGTTTTVLHGNAAGNPVFGSVSLATDVSNTLPIANGGTSQTTAALARASSGLNVDQFTGHGDSIYTILATDRTVGTNAAFTASRTWTLPAANGVNPGQEIVIADFQGTVTGANTLVITRAGADTINGGGTSVTIAAANGAYLLKSDGTSKWTAQALGAAAAGGVSSVTCFGVAITTSGTCTVAATKSSEQTGTSTTDVVTPSQQQSHDSATKGWALITGSTGAILASYNVSGVVRVSAGVYTVSWTTAFATTNYACQSTTESTAATYAQLINGTRATGSVQITSLTISPLAAADATTISVVCEGRQ